MLIRYHVQSVRLDADGDTKTIHDRFEQMLVLYFQLPDPNNFDENFLRQRLKIMS